MKKNYFLKKTKFLLGFVVLFLMTFNAYSGNKYKISLDGGESFYVNDDASDHLDVSGSWTFEAWINVHSYSSGDYDCIMDRRYVFSFYLIDDDDKDYAIRFVARDGSSNIIATIRCDGTSGSTSADMMFDTWYHVAATYDGTTAKLFVNGTEYDSNTDPDWALSTTTDNAINIGGRYWGSYSRQMTDADIDEVRVSDIDRAISDMQTDQSAEAYTSDGNTVLLMHLDDQGDSPTFISGTGLAGTTGDNDIASGDYVLITSTSRLLQPKYQSNVAAGNWSDASSWEYWDGATGTWNTATLAPDYADDDIEILNGHTITVGSDVTTNETTVGNGGVLTISNGNTLTISSNTDGLSISGEVNVDGTLLLNSGSHLVINSDASFTGSMTVSSSGTLTNNGTLTVQSNASGNGSLIVNGSVSGDATVQRYIAAYTAASGSGNGWHLLGSPVNNMAISGSDFEPGTNDDLYAWDEATNTWLNYKVSGNNITNFTNGEGYLVAYQTTATKNFTGTVNTSDISFSNLSLNADDGDGWHLLGNPYPSALTWNDGAGNWNLNNVGGVAKVWDGTNGNYSDVSSGDIIPSTNGFFVQVTSGTNGLTIPAADRVHDATNNFKNTSAANLKESLQFKVTNDANGYCDVATLGFKADATEDWDIAFDSHKLFSMVKTAPSLWTVSKDQDFSTSYLPEIKTAYSVPLDFRAGENTVYHLSVKGADSFNGTSLVLEDKQTGQMIDLSKETSYDFSAEKGDDVNRFTLHINGVTGINHLGQDDGIQVYSFGHTVYLHGQKVLTGKVSVFNTLGQKVFEGNLNGVNRQQIRLNGLQKGIYFVRLKEGQNTMTKKVFIQ
jgi:hypothetical protein